MYSTVLVVPSFLPSFTLSHFILETRRDDAALSLSFSLILLYSESFFILRRREEDFVLYNDTLAYI